MNVINAHTLSRIRKPRRLPKSPIQKFPKRLFLKYADEIKTRIIAQWREAFLKIAPKLQSIEKFVELERPTGLLKHDAWSDEMTNQLDMLSTDYDTIAAQSEAIAAGQFEAVNGLSHVEWYAAAKKVVGVNLFAHEPWVMNEAKAFIHENVQLITNSKTQVLSDISRIVSGGFRQGRRWESISDEILNGSDLTPGVFQKSETRADLIARDQTSKLWGNLNQKRQEGAGISIYQWHTAEDERVRGAAGGKYAKSRPSHAALDNKYCKWDDPTVYANSLKDAMSGNWISREDIKNGPAESEHPGAAINCRCVSSAVFETLFADFKTE